MLITNGKDEKNVTKGVYRQYYKHLGYHPVIKVGYEKSKVNNVEKPKINEVEKLKEKIEKKEEIVSQKNTPKKLKK